MSRRRTAEKRKITPDPIYHNDLVAKFINIMMSRGKKSVSEKIFYSSISTVATKVGDEPVTTFDKIINNVRPLIEVRSRRVGGATYQVPMEIRIDRSISLAMKWIIKCSKKRKGKSMIEKLIAEMIAAYNNEGEAIKTKINTHKMAEANRAFSHYKWGTNKTN